MTSEQLPDHWPLGPSSASRWLICPGSAGVSNEQSDAADLGTLGHSIVEQLLKGAAEVFMTSEQGELFRSLDPERRMFFIDAVNTCANFVRSISGDYDFMLLETKIQSEHIEDHGGTIDVILATDTKLRVIDFKFGFVPVEAEDNDQLQCYLNLARQTFPDSTEFEGTIVQPAYRGPDTAVFTAKQLDEHLDRVRDAASRRSEKHAGVKHCRWCPLLRECGEAAKLMAASVQEFPDFVQFTSQIGPEGPTQEQIEQVERFHMIQKLAKTAYDASGALLKKWAKQGKSLGQHRVADVTRMYWRHDAREFLEAQSLEKLDYEVDSKPALKTPSQVRAALGLTSDEFKEKFRDVLELRGTPTLKAKMKPSLDELAEFDTPLPTKEN